MPKANAAGTDSLSNPCLAGVERLVVRLKGQGVGLLGVAYSGGADSTALLLAALQCWPGHVQALHVNHGMQAAAADFESHCQRFCAELAVPLHVVRTQVVPARGESPEDAARKARYGALAGMADKFAINHVALAQHADDQAETLLLALSRGAGLRGLSGMVGQFERGGVIFHRPVLDVSGLALRHWLVQTHAAFVDDPSNANLAFTRNRIRLQVLPLWADAFPAFRETLARSARHAAQAQHLLDQLARDDLRVVGVPPRIKDLQGLSPERQTNVLRHWLAATYQCLPSEVQLRELLKQIDACRTRGHRIHLKLAQGQLRREGAVLAWARV